MKFFISYEKTLIKDDNANLVKTTLNTEVERSITIESMSDIHDIEADLESEPTIAGWNAYIKILNIIKLPIG